MKAANRRGKRAKLQEQIAGAVIVDFYGYGHNPWTWEQAVEAQRRHPEKERFIRREGERKEDAEAKMMDLTVGM